MVIKGTLQIKNTCKAFKTLAVQSKVRMSCYDDALLQIIYWSFSKFFLQKEGCFAERVRNVGSK